MKNERSSTNIQLNFKVSEWNIQVSSFLTRFRTYHCCGNQVTSLHEGDGFELVSKLFLVGNRFHVTLRIVRPEKLFKQKL